MSVLFVFNVCECSLYFGLWRLEERVIFFGSRFMNEGDVMCGSWKVNLGFYKENKCF